MTTKQEKEQKELNEKIDEKVREHLSAVTLRIVEEECTDEFMGIGGDDKQVNEWLKEVASNLDLDTFDFWNWWNESGCPTNEDGVYAVTEQMDFHAELNSTVTDVMDEIKWELKSDIESELDTKDADDLHRIKQFIEKMYE